MDHIAGLERHVRQRLVALRPGRRRCRRRPERGEVDGDPLPVGAES
jgi:hypothetical protein